MEIDSPNNQTDTIKAPRWALQPFAEFSDHTERLQQLIHLSKSGISATCKMPDLVEALANLETSSVTNEHVERAKEGAELAQREVDEDFPLLHAQTTISLWSALESVVRLFVARWLENEKSAMEVEAIQRLKVRIGEYERLEGEDRFFYIVDRLEQETSAPLRCGVLRFEAILEPFGLSAVVAEELRQQLYELNQIRNVLVHRSGVADRRLVEACPWLGLRVGQTIRLDHRRMNTYFKAVMEYAANLVVTVAERFGVNMDGFRGRPVSSPGVALSGT